MEPVAGDVEARGLGWRTRVSLHVDDDGRVGPYAARSHTVVPVDDLPLATAAVQRPRRSISSSPARSASTCSIRPKAERG